MESHCGKNISAGIYACPTFASLRLPGTRKRRSLRYVVLSACLALSEYGEGVSFADVCGGCVSIIQSGAKRPSIPHSAFRIKIAHCTLKKRPAEASRFNNSVLLTLPFSLCKHMLLRLLLKQLRKQRCQLRMNLCLRKQ